MSRLDPDHQQALELLSDSLSSYLRDNWDFNARRAAIESEAGWQPAIWQTLSQDLGLLLAAESEEHGGLGLGLPAQGRIARVLGQHLALTPYLETAIIGAALLRGGGEIADAALADLTQGAILAPALYEPHSRYNAHTVATVAENHSGRWTLSGQKRLVRAAPWASQLIVSARTSAGLSLFLVDATAHGLKAHTVALHDGPRASEITLANTPATLIHTEGQAAPVITRAVEEGLFGLCAEAVGVMQRLNSATLDYVRQRKQFGIAIGSFQALQFRLADMAMALEEAEAVLAPTLEALQSPDAAIRARATSAAKLTIDRACEIVSTGAVQLHGAIGLTDELDVSHAFKRALMIQHELGDTHHHSALRAAA